MRPATSPTNTARTVTSPLATSPVIAALRGDGAGRRGHPVAGTADGLDQRRRLDRRQRLAQALDVDIDGALLDEDVVAPDAVEQLPAAVDALRVCHQEVQQPELGRADLDLARRFAA